MSIPREPRQKMINMMYLVLTALLALNVSAEILNAFKTVNKSLEKTNDVVNSSTSEIMTSLKAKVNEPGTRTRAEEWLPLAEKTQSYSSTLYTYIQGLKDRIMIEAGADPAKGKLEFKEDNLDVATRIMVEKGEGKKLHDMLEKYQKDIFDIHPLIKKQFEAALPINTETPATHNKANKTWEAAYFRMVPTVAALTMLSKFQNDVKTSENKVVAFCHEQVGKVEIRFNQYEAIIGQNSQVLLAGQDLEITAGLAAFNSENKPTVTIGGKAVSLNEKGMAVWKSPVNASGKVPVVVSFKDQDGKDQTRTFSVDYTVGQSNAAVQLDKMNVLFIGVDNPVTVSGSGNVDQIKASISGGNGTLNGGKGHYIARVNQETDNCIITVTTPDGKSTPMRFRVRSIPDPTPMVGQSKSGEMSAAAFKSQAGVRAIVENFFYETQFNVTSFTITGADEGFPEGIEEAVNTGAAWNEARKIVAKCRAGSFVTIEKIRAVGPDGRTRLLTPLIYQLK